MENRANYSLLATSSATTALMSWVAERCFLPEPCLSLSEVFTFFFLFCSRKSPSFGAAVVVAVFVAVVGMAVVAAAR
jgi:hypothetical protein